MLLRFKIFCVSVLFDVVVSCLMSDCFVLLFYRLLWCFIMLMACWRTRSLSYVNAYRVIYVVLVCVKCLFGVVSRLFLYVLMMDMLKFLLMNV